jgi:hypothetical protein
MEQIEFFCDGFDCWMGGGRVGEVSTGVKDEKWENIKQNFVD